MRWFHRHKWARLQNRAVIEKRPLGHRVSIVHDDICVDCGRQRTYLAWFFSNMRSAWHFSDPESCGACVRMETDARLIFGTVVQR